MTTEKVLIAELMVLIRSKQLNGLLEQLILLHQCKKRRLESFACEQAETALDLKDQECALQTMAILIQKIERSG